MAIVQALPYYVGLPTNPESSVLLHSITVHSHIHAPVHCSTLGLMVPPPSASSSIWKPSKCTYACNSNTRWPGKYNMVSHTWKIYILYSGFTPP